MSRASVPGSPSPLGATWDGAGVNFALFSEHAEAVELCLFDQTGAEERLPVVEKTDGVWHCYLSDAHPGLLYGYRVHGPYDPARGHRFNPNKLLLDPYAKATSGPVDWERGRHFGYDADGEEDFVLDEGDNAVGAIKGRVIDTAFTWGDDRPPGIPADETVFYEAHVKGLTQTHPGVPEALRGTYAGLASDAVIKHLLDLGVTAVELLPVQAFLQDKHLVDAGLSNYWGYNTYGFFTPDWQYAATHDPVTEFKTMVRKLHAAGLEVILDVVYNHTAEGNHVGPTLSFRGIDNASYYRLVPDEPRFYMDYTGTGNSLNLHNPRVMQLVMDSLRYWVEEMRVDGFRFDLAPTLMRERHGEFDPWGGFARAVRQDPVLSRVKLIAEPWDVGPNGYQVGSFPGPFDEWNGKYRDEVRSYWKGDGGLVGEFASRITGSSDLYGRRNRPQASVNFITAHDGFTLQDLVSYNEKHNEANGEGNNDGESDNDSWNCGVEGPTDDPEILALRGRQKRNLMATLLLSQGVPMILHGDELGRTQRGNNNVYCQDNEFSWIDWDLSGDDRQFMRFVQRVVALRKEHPTFRRRRFFRGTAQGEEGHDVLWLTPGGREMSQKEWETEFARTLGLLIMGSSGEAHRSATGALVPDDDFLLLANAHHGEIPFLLPSVPVEARWQAVLDTSNLQGLGLGGFFKPGDEYPLEARSLVLLMNPRLKTPAL